MNEIDLKRLQAIQAASFHETAPTLSDAFIITEAPSSWGGTVLTCEGFAIVVDKTDIAFRSANPRLTTPRDVTLMIALLTRARELMGEA